MKHYKNIIIAGFAANLLSLFGVAAGQISQQVESQNRLTARQQSLTTIAKHIRSDSCWENQQKQPFKLGDEIKLPGSIDGKAPTSCVRVPGTKQYLFIAYKNETLKVTQIYSFREVKNQLSTKDN